MTVRSPIRVCIIEDHAIVRAGIKMLLDAQSDIEVVGEAVDRKTALEIAARECPDVFLVDNDRGRFLCRLDISLSTRDGRRAV